MKNRFSRVTRSLTLGSVALALALGGAVTGCDGGGTPPESETYMFGLSEADLLDMHTRLYADRYDAATWLELHRGEFQCQAFGSLCDQVGDDAAYDITEQTYVMLLDGATVADLDAYLEIAVPQAEELWEASGMAVEDDDRWTHTSYAYGGSNRERVRLKLRMGTSVNASWWARTDCTYQIKGLFGIWGGNQKAHLRSHIEGTLIEPAGNDFASDTTSEVYFHTLKGRTVRFYPNQPNTARLDAYGRCEARKGSWNATAGRSEDHWGTFWP